VRLDGSLALLAASQLYDLGKLFPISVPVSSHKMGLLTVVPLLRAASEDEMEIIFK
jgi:hypothetical protein